MLGWLAAAAAPILIHLWSRRRRHETDWAAMQFLLAAIQRRRRRLLLEDGLLLAVRTLLIALVALAVFVSYQERGASSASHAEQTHRLLVLDASYSMTYRPDDRSRWDRAKQAAQRIVEQAPPGDAFSLVLLAGPARIVVGAPSFKRREFLDELSRLSPTQSIADVAGALACAERVFETASREQPRLTRREACFITDLGRCGWAPPPGSAAAAEIRRRGEALARIANIEVVDVGQASAENAAVIDVRTAAHAAIAGRAVPFEVRLRNFGRSDLPRRSLELWADGRRAAQQTVDLPAGSETVASMTCRFDAAGDHAVEVRMQPDRLELDDRRFLTVRVLEAVRALCVDGQSAGRAGASRYLRLALAPVDSADAPLPVQCEVVAESGLIERDLTPFDVVFLCNVAQFTPSEARLLWRCLERGGSLVFFLGERVQAQRYNRQLAAADAERILPARLEDRIDRPQQRLDPLDYAHPLVRSFRGREKAGLLSTPVAKHYRLALAPQSEARTALALADGDPLIVEEPRGRGRVILVATSADASWSDLPAWPSFVPLVQETLAWCLNRQAEQRNFTVGQPLSGAPPDSVNGPGNGKGGLSPFSISLPDGRVERLAVEATERGSVWSFADTNVRGVYTVGRAALYAVNLDPAESDLATISLEQLRDEVWSGVSFAHQAAPEPGAASLAGDAAPDRLTVGMLCAALLLAIWEVLLAWRTGERRT